jgi:hypothetical protein
MKLKPTFMGLSRLATITECPGCRLPSELNDVSVSFRLTDALERYNRLL